MDLIDFLVAALLGVVEGLTEFLPVSSTGHLILLERLLGAETPEPFIVMIQLGAVLAICVVYLKKIIEVTLGLPTRPEARRFALAIFIAFLPAAVLGILFHDFIKSVLFSPLVVAVALIVGGVIMLLAERYRPPAVIETVDDMPVQTALKIGLCQAVAMIPGVSRSGATIVGAMMFRVDRRAAAEFSFFLSMPTMLGAFTVDFLQNRDQLVSEDLAIIATGFAFAFLAGLAVVRVFLAIVSRMGFAPFAWYRIALGAVMLGVLSVV